MAAVKGRILIIDDEDIILISLKELFEDEGYGVWTASSGKKAFEIVENIRPDVALVDLIMPVMSAVEICKEIKKVYSKIEILLMSGNSIELERNQSVFIAAGGRGEGFKKPFDIERLFMVIEEILQEKKLDTWYKRYKGDYYA